MIDLQKILEKINKGIAPYKGKRRNYEMTAEEMFLMGEYAKREPLECVVAMFDYGFFKGVNYQKKQSKKKGGHSMNTPNSIRHTWLTGYSVKYFDLREPKPRCPKFKMMVYDCDMLKALEMLGQNVVDHIKTRFANGGYHVIEVKKHGPTAVEINMEAAYFAEMNKMETGF